MDFYIISTDGSDREDCNIFYSSYLVIHPVDHIDHERVLRDLVGENPESITSDRGQDFVRNPSKLVRELLSHGVDASLLTPSYILGSER